MALVSRGGWDPSGGSRGADAAHGAGGNTVSVTRRKERFPGLTLAFRGSGQAFGVVVRNL